MKRFPISLICGISVIVVTILLYFTILGNVILEAIHFIALVAIVLAEVVTTAYAAFANGSPRKVAAAVVSAVMIPAAVTLSAVYIVSFPSGYGAYLGWYFAGMFVVNAIALILVHFDSNKTEEDDSLQAAKENMLNMRKLVKCVMQDQAAKPYLTRLRGIEEALHFSNDNVIVAADAEIQNMILLVQEYIADENYDIPGLLDKIENAVKTRTIMTSRNA